MKLSKVHFGALGFVAAVLFVFFALLAQVATAAEISRHAQQYVGTRKAKELCEARGGTATWTQTEPYTLHDDPQGYRLHGDQLLIVCKLPQASTTPLWLLTWTRPTTRADGTALAVNQIAGYRIRNGETLIAMVPGTEYITEPMASISTLTIATIDTNGKESARVSFR